MRLLGLLLVAGMVAPSAGSAQRHLDHDTGSMIPVPQRARIPDIGNQAERSRIALAEFARCTVDRHDTQLRKLLILPPEQSDGRAWAALADNECLSSGEMRFKPMLLRGAVFGELYRRRINSPRVINVRLGTPAPYGVSSAPLQSGDGALQMAMLAFADCVIQRDPADASTMIVSPTASKEQDRALQALKPSLGPCLPAGQQITLSRPVLEGAIAEVLYRGPAQPVPAESK